MKRRSRNTEETFTLFPFLAVLLCTMGLLTLIFALVAQTTTSDEPELAAQDAAQNTEEPQAPQDAVLYFDETTALGSEPNGRIIDAETIAAAAGTRRSDSFSQFDSLSETPEGAAEGSDAADAEEEPDPYELALVQTGEAPLWNVLRENEALEWMVGELEMAKDVADSMIEDERSRLANAEVGLANIRAEMEATREKYSFLETQDATAGDVVAQRKERVASLDSEITALRSETEALRARNANAKKSYAIIPYQGKKGTFRRPIYVECNGSGCVIQPENVRFTEEDLLLAKYPGNPFDAALRVVAQRYLVEDGAKTAIGNAVEPYPLLIVRPSGAEFFYQATAALASWGGVFGYEFVEEDQEIAYPPIDLQTAKLANDQANYARNRLAMQLQALLASSQVEGPRFGGAPSNEFGEAPASGLGARLGTGVRLGAAAIPQRSDVAGGSGGSGSTAGFGSNAVGGARLREGRYVGVLSEYNSSSNAQIVGEDFPLPEYVGRYSGRRSHGPSASNARNAGQEVAQGVGQNVSQGVGQNVGQGVGQNAGQGAETGASSGTVASTGALGLPNLGGVGTPESTGGVVEGVEGTEGTVAPTQGGTAPEYMKQFAKSPDATRDNAARDGEAIDYEKTLGNTTYQNDPRLNRRPEKPDSRAPNPEGAFSVTEELARPATSGNERGMLMICMADRYVFPRQPGFRSDATIAIDGKAREAVEKELEDAIALCVRSWGAAGRNHYWAPFLRVEVRDGGEENFRALEDFCRRQGLGVARAQAGTSAR